MILDTWLLVAVFGGGVFLSPLVVALLKAIISWAGDLSDYIANRSGGGNGVPPRPQ